MWFGCKYDYKNINGDNLQQHAPGKEPEKAGK
jgi:hypothetical protein